MTASSKPPHLPWHQPGRYWLCVLARGNGISATLTQELLRQGMQEVREGAAVAYVMLADAPWASRWQIIYEALQAAGAGNTVDAAVIAGDAPLQAAQVEAARRTCAEVQEIAQNLWLGDALQHNRFLCYLQPVMNASGQVFGYESFARVRGQDGAVIGGGAIVKAARVLSLQFAVDRHMQIQAVRTFMNAGLSGMLFVNFIPGFIQRPEVYLEGLGTEAAAQNLSNGQIVLDVTNSESSHDVEHICRIAEFARSKGYTLALDDVASAASVQAMLPHIKPNFVKLDMNLVHAVAQSEARETIGKIAIASHAHGAQVLAEGVESAEIMVSLKELKVDLFQGYYFSPPVPAEIAKAADRAAG